jgi:type IV fimbrial biogenesis protein FimT
MDASCRDCRRSSATRRGASLSAADRSPVTESGFTLHEMLAALMVSSIVIMAVVSLRPALQNNSLTAQVNLLAADLHLARTEALKRGRRVTLCRSPTATACASGTQWHEGWILFVDEDSDNVLDAGESVLRVQGPLAAGTTLRYSSYSFLAYKPDGGVTRDGTFAFCDSRGSSRARGIVINWTGRTRITTRASDNTPLPCPN